MGITDSWDSQEVLENHCKSFFFFFNLEKTTFHYDHFFEFYFILFFIQQVLISYLFYTY